MKINKINTDINRINFKENALSREMQSANAILMLRDPNAAVRFQKNQEIAKKADSIDSNPIVALGYKLYRTFNKLKANENVSSVAENKNFNMVA